VPGQGSRLSELLDVIGEGSTSDAERRVRTDLLLTGRLLDFRDRERIRTAIEAHRRP
jgi:hypothetical protein